MSTDETQHGNNSCGLDNGGCLELCLFNGSYPVCRCFHGKVSNNGKSCTEYESFLMYSSITSIQTLHMFENQNPNDPYKSITSPLMKNAISLTFDYSTKRIFYSDIQRGNINVVYFNGSDHKVLLHQQGSVEGVTFDEKTKTLYWTCQSDATINAKEIMPGKESEMVKKIVTLNPDDKPRGIAVDSCESLLFWTNWNSKAPSIQRSYVSGMKLNLSFSIITTSIRMPNGLALDRYAQKLYWGDARLDKIELCNYDGTNRQVLLKDAPNHPFDLAIYGDYIFWTDWVLHAIVRANKYTAEDIVKLRVGNSRLMGIVAVANDTYTCDYSPCKISNGGCEDLCTLNQRGEVVCECLPNRSLLPDHKRCASIQNNCTSDEFQCRETDFCISKDKACDGFMDCSDGSDEDYYYCGRLTSLLFKVIKTFVSSFFYFYNFNFHN